MLDILFENVHYPFQLFKKYCVPLIVSIVFNRITLKHQIDENHDFLQLNKNGISSE